LTQPKICFKRITQRIRATTPASFVATCRALKITSHVAASDRQRSGSALDERTLHHRGHVIGHKKPKPVEEIFGWIKTVATFRRTRYQGCNVNQLAAYLLGVAYNLMRICQIECRDRITSECPKLAENGRRLRRTEMETPSPKTSMAPRDRLPAHFLTELAAFAALNFLRF